MISVHHELHTSFSSLIICEWKSEQMRGIWRISRPSERHSDRARKLNWWVLGIWLCHIETHIHPTVCVAMASTDKRAKPLMFRSTMKAFITTVTSVIVLTYHRPNADISRHVAVFSGWKRYFKNKTQKGICMKRNYFCYTFEIVKVQIWLFFSWLKAEKTEMQSLPKLLCIIHAAQSFATRQRLGKYRSSLTLSKVTELILVD